MIEKTNEATKKLGLEEWRDNWGHTAFRPQGKVQHKAPAIVREYEEKEIIEGRTIAVRMYECEGGRTFVADKYDEMFIPAHDNRRMKLNRKVVSNIRYTKNKAKHKKEK